MKREDKISVEMTLQEAAQIYAVIARANGSCGYDVYKKLMDIVDPEKVAYNKHIDRKFSVIDYQSIQKEFEATIFDKKSPAQVELEVLQSKIADLQKQAQKFQEVIKA